MVRYFSVKALRHRIIDGSSTAPNRIPVCSSLWRFRSHNHFLILTNELLLTSIIKIAIKKKYFNILTSSFFLLTKNLLKIFSLLSIARSLIKCIYVFNFFCIGEYFPRIFQTYFTIFLHKKRQITF